jgi:hypothetical protein
MNTGGGGGREGSGLRSEKLSHRNATKREKFKKRVNQLRLEQGSQTQTALRAT